MEGDAAPEDNGELSLSIRAANMLSNGMGGYDYAGLPYVMRVLGFRDVDALLYRLMVIRAHQPDKDS